MVIFDDKFADFYLAAPFVCVLIFCRQSIKQRPIVYMMNRIIATGTALIIAKPLSGQQT